MHQTKRITYMTIKSVPPPPPPRCTFDTQIFFAETACKSNSFNAQTNTVQLLHGLSSRTVLIREKIRHARSHCCSISICRFLFVLSCDIGANKSYGILLIISELHCNWKRFIPSALLDRNWIGASYLQMSRSSWMTGSNRQVVTLWKVV